MSWLASLPRWVLLGAFVVLILGVVVGRVLSCFAVSGAAEVMLFLLFFATLMAFVGRRDSPRPPSPH